MLAAATTLAACTPTAPLRDGPPQPSATSAEGAPPFPSSGGGKPFDRVLVRRFQLSVEMPDPAGWHPVRAKSQFVELEHPATGSHLVVRAWFESENMTRQACEERARRARELPAGDVVVRETAAVPDGFDTELTVGTKAAASVHGYLTAFGSRARHCFAFAFSTEHGGRDAARIVEARLAVMRERTLGTLRVVSELDADPREKPPLDPLSPDLPVP